MNYVWQPLTLASQDGHWNLVLRTAVPRWISIERSGQAAIIQDERLTRDWTC